MGFIYSFAKQVVVAFSGVSFTAIEQIVRIGQLDEDNLRSWNRMSGLEVSGLNQEVVNSKQLHLCQEYSEDSINGEEFLNRLGNSMKAYRKRHNLNGIDFSEKFPRLSALESLIVDWFTAGYLERSALQVISNMDHREHLELTNHFYAMIGAVTQRPSRTTTNCTVSDLAELFMTVCEEKNDYSFIYSDAPRNTQKGRRWRPVAGLLHSILPWSCSGERQPAHQLSEGLLLENVVSPCFVPVLSGATKKFITSWVGQQTLSNNSDEQMAKESYTTLQRMGFVGSGEYELVEGGIFFPLHPVKALGKVLVSTASSGCLVLQVCFYRS
jgi:hypothetical protein